MSIKTTVWLIIFGLGLTTVSSAQYFNETHRQSDDAINLLKTHNIREKITYIQQADNSIPYGVDYFDTSGRVTMIANPDHHEHFGYDDKGRMTYWLDSANDGRRFEKYEYHFGYNARGAVNEYKGPGTESKFFFTGQNVQEDVLHKALVTEVRKYNYNNEGKLTQELFHEPGNDSTAKITYSRKVFYNKYGDLASEIIYNPIKDCNGDSTIIINTYDNKGKLIHSQKRVKKLTCGAVPNTISRKMITGSVSYIYNASGQLVTESMISNDPALNYKKEYVYDEYGFLVKVLGFDGKGKSTTNYLYSYTYYPRKR